MPTAVFHLRQDAERQAVSYICTLKQGYRVAVLFLFDPTLAHALLLLSPPPPRPSASCGTSFALLQNSSQMRPNIFRFSFVACVTPPIQFHEGGAEDEDAAERAARAAGRKRSRGGKRASASSASSGGGSGSGSGNRKAGRGKRSSAAGDENTPPYTKDTKAKKTSSEGKVTAGRAVCLRSRATWKYDILLCRGAKYGIFNIFAVSWCDKTKNRPLEARLFAGLLVWMPTMPATLCHIACPPDRKEARVKTSG